MVNNLTEGKPLKLLFFFAMPTVVGNLFRQSYDMVGSMVVGRLMGEDALATVSSSFPVVFLFVVIATGPSMGCTVVTSQFFRTSKVLETKITVPTVLMSLGVIGFIIMGTGEIIMGLLPTLLGTDSSTTADSLTYLRIYFGGAALLFLYNSLNGIYNALRDSQTFLKFLVVSALTNIVLNLLLIIQFNMGVAGVAWATLIVQGICAVFSLFVLIARLRKVGNEEAVKGKLFTSFDMFSAERTAKVGVLSMFQQSIVSISMMLMRGLVNSYGEVFTAGYTAATKIDTLAMMPNINFPNTMSSYAAQNIGARKMNRVKQGYKASMFMVVVFSLIITSIIFLFGLQLLGLFLKQGAEGSAMGYRLSCMKTVSVLYTLMGALFVGNDLLRGTGNMGTFMLSSVMNLFSCVAIAYLLTHSIGASAIWWSIPTGWVVGAPSSFLRVRSEKQMARRLVD